MGTMHIADIPPLAFARFPSELSGETGSNRAINFHVQMNIHTDVDAINAWLARSIVTAGTYSNYRKEAERLLLWSIVEREKPLSSLTHDDLRAYQLFLGDPQPVEHWLMQGGRKRSRFDPEWRPFVGALSATSQRHSIAVLHSLFSWLVKIGYLASNPLK